MRNLLLTLSVLSAGSVFALPNNGAAPTLVEGAPVLTNTTGNQMNIRTNSNVTVLDWNSFSISQMETVHFERAGGQSFTVFNKVTGLESSNLNGTLSAPNGNIYIFNPRGINVAGTGVIYASGCVLSTLLPNSFDPNSDMIYSGSSTNSVVNQGTITALSGDAMLIGFRVKNTGAIEASGFAGLAAGTEVLVKPSSEIDRIFIQQILPSTIGGNGVEIEGTISALNTAIKADGNAYALAINQTGGTLQANGCTQGEGNAILLVANPGTYQNGSIQLAGTIKRTGVSGVGCDVKVIGYEVALLDGANITTSGNVGGGNVTIGANQGGSELITTEHVYIAQNASITADGLTTGSGGNISYYGNDSALILGSLKSRGGSVSGNGGQISGTGVIYHGFGSLVDLSSPKGQMGRAILRSKSFIVAGDENWGTSYMPPLYSDSGRSSVITLSSIQQMLNKNHLSVIAEGGSDITVYQAFTWSKPNVNLTLQAEDNIFVNGLVTVTGNSSASTEVLTLIASNYISGTHDFSHTVPTGFSLNRGSVGLTVSEKVNIHGGSEPNTYSCLATNLGNITAQIGDNLNIRSGPSENANAYMKAAGNINIDAFASSSGDIRVIANDCSSAYIDITSGVLNVGLSHRPDDFILAAGCCSANNRAYVGSLTGSASIHSYIKGNYLVTGGGSGINNTASFCASNGANNHFDFYGSSFRLIGGIGGTGNSAFVRNFGNGTVTISVLEDIGIFGGSQNSIGASAQVLANKVHLHALGNLSLIAGNGMMSHVALLSSMETMANIKGNVTLSGGTSRESYAAMVTDNGNITINNTNGSGNLRLTGGIIGMDNSYALIRAAKGDINIGDTHPFNLIDIIAGSSGSSTFAVIKTDSGNIHVNALRDITIIGGQNGMETYAGILAANDGNIWVTSGRDITAITGTNQFANAFIKTLNGEMAINAGRDTILQGSCSIPNLASIETHGNNQSLEVVVNRDLTLIKNAKIIGPKNSEIIVDGIFTPGGCGSPVPPVPPKEQVMLVPFNMYELFWRINTFVYYDWYNLSSEDFWQRANYTDGPRCL